ncbi:MAG: MFS transporter [Acetobacteraceae bacterium]
MQFSGVFARIFLGWLADRTGRPAVNLTIQAFIASALVLAFAALPDHPGLLLAGGVAGAAGWFGASWNGIYMAEVARLSPRDRIVEMTSSSVVFTFLGYVAGPSLFSVLVTLSGGWRVSFAIDRGAVGADGGGADGDPGPQRRRPVPLINHVASCEMIAAFRLSGSAAAACLPPMGAIFRPDAPPATLQETHSVVSSRLYSAATMKISSTLNCT